MLASTTAQGILENSVALRVHNALGTSSWDVVRGADESEARYVCVVVVVVVVVVAPVAASLEEPRNTVLQQPIAVHS